MGDNIKDYSSFHLPVSVLLSDEAAHQNHETKLPQDSENTVLYDSCLWNIMLQASLIPQAQLLSEGSKAM